MATITAYLAGNATWMDEQSAAAISRLSAAQSRTDDQDAGADVPALGPTETQRPEASQVIKQEGK